MNFAKDTFEKLTDCLRGELSAVDSYDIALRHVRQTEPAATLRQLRDSHDRRVVILRERLRVGGAEPATTAGIRGALGKIAQAGADLFGERATIMALEQGEERLTRSYTQAIERCDADTQGFLRAHITPHQQRTHELCRSLKRFFKTT